MIPHERVGSVTATPKLRRLRRTVCFYDGRFVAEGTTLTENWRSSPATKAALITDNGSGLLQNRHFFFS
jgi:hypothetical protein